MVDRFAIIIGAMRCGTTSLFELLAQHPEVAACTVKEPNFFADSDNWKKGMGWYQRLWSWDRSVHKVALEASTHYTKVPLFPNAAPRLAGLGPRTRLIFMVRDPIERIESHYAFGSTQPWRRSLSRPPRVDEHAINVSEYAMQLDNYMRVFELDSLLIITLDEFRRAPNDVLTRVCSFLGIDQTFHFRDALTHRNSSQDVIRRAPTIFSRGMGRLPFAVDLAKRLIPGPMETTGFRSFVTREIRATRIRLSPQQRAYVTARLQDDVRRLRIEYGVDTSAWSIQ